jgi:hypothetical protein
MVTLVISSNLSCANSIIIRLPFYECLEDENKGVISLSHHLKTFTLDISILLRKPKFHDPNKKTSHWTSGLIGCKLDV